jgi:serine-type D-Ala-D-Ala carboxypeptidase (penicillin-binding protein 5/6)
MRTRRFAAVLSAAICTLAATVSVGVVSAQAAAGQPAAAAAPPGIVAAGADLVNVATGQTIWSRGLRIERPMASITKIMTAMVILAEGRLNRNITVTDAALQYAAEHRAGTAGLLPGDVLTAGQLLEGMLLPSGADAAYLLASSYGPGWHAFVRAMNAEARKLGMRHTYFANFDGLPWPTPTASYSTPHDLLILGEAAMKVPLLRTIVDQRSYLIKAGQHHHRYFWTTTDLLLTSYRGAIGIKTGFTTAAGYCLLFEAQRGGTDLMGVVLDSTNTNASMRFTAARRLLNWGFARR